jgi:uracil-DNA glycosylase
VLAIAENPAEDEVRLGRPLVGESGVRGWNPALAAIGKKRPDVALTNTICCKPPGEASGAYKRMERAIKRENDRLAEAGESARWPHPAECCAPRLAWEVSHFNNIILLGASAARAVLGTTSGIMALRGGPRELPTTDSSIKRKVLPTVHPAFVNRAPQWRSVFESDLAKAFRWFEDRRNWSEPHYTWKPSPGEFRAWLARPARFWAYDYETDSREPITAKVDCIGFAALVEPPEVVPCEKCAGTGQCVTVFDPGDGWVPRPADSTETKCACCNGVGVRTIDVRMCVVPIRSVEDRSYRFYTPAQEEEVKQAIREFFEDRSRWKLAHNGLGYDELVTHQWLRCRTEPRADTLPMARARAPDLPKALGVIGSIFTDVHAWKADNEGNKIAMYAKRDRQLHYYNGLDCAVTARIYDPLQRIVTERGYHREIRTDIKPPEWPARVPWTLSGVDVYRQEMCQEIHYNGLFVDQRRREEHRVKLLADEARYRAVAIEHAAALGVHGPVKSKRRGPEPFNPGSDKQIAHVLFDVWGLIPTTFSEETGEPSVKDEVLRGILTSDDLAEDREAFRASNGKSGERYKFVDAIRRMRRARKARSTFIDPMERRDLWTPIYSTKGKQVNKTPLCWEDGRVRPSTSAMLNAVGRLNMSDGLHQIPKEYRDIFCAQPVLPDDDPRWPGRVLIGGDVDQFHLRIIANLWRIGRLLEAFHEGIDPHSALALDFFGDVFRNADGWGPDGFSLKRKPKGGSAADKMRNLGKVIRYQGAYADVPEGIHKSVIKVEDKKTGDLPFAHVTVREVARLYKIWMRAEPEWEGAWQAACDRYARNGGWIEEPVFGRRSGGLEDGKKQAVVNFEILACEPSIVAIMEARVRDAFPFGHAGAGTGLIHQGHDAMNVETDGFAWVEMRGEKEVVVCDAETERKRKTLEDCMNVRIPGHEIPYTSAAQVGPVRDRYGNRKLSNYKEA